MRTCLFIVLLVMASAAWAQELPDSGLPDGSIGEGSADGMTEENDPQGGPCLASKDCLQGFACVSSRCVPVKPKNIGCSAAPVAFVLVAAASLARRRRRSV